MSIEDPTKQDLLPGQPDEPTPVEVEPQSNEEKSPIRIRTHRNPERGTELTYATIPLKDVDSPKFNEEIADAIKRFYDLKKVNSRLPNGHFSRSKYTLNELSPYKQSERLAKEIKNFVDSEKEEMNFKLSGIEVKKFNSNELHYFSLKKIGGKLLIMPRPFVHTLRSYDHKGKIKSASDCFDDLKLILDRGFRSTEIFGNAVMKNDSNHKFNGGYLNPTKEGKKIIDGDGYSIELFSDKGKRGSGYEYSIFKASPSRISSVNICLDKTASEEQKERKMQFYKEEITKKYGIPIQFYEDLRDLNNPELKRYNMLQKRVFPEA
jgi:hypothetical protein